MECVKARNSRGTGQYKLRPVLPFKRNLEMADHPTFNMFKSVLAGSSIVETVSLQPTSDEIVKWAIYESPHGKMGVIRLESFTPSSPTASVNDIILIIRELLVDQLADTDCLVFDVRENPGGIGICLLHNKKLH